MANLYGPRIVTDGLICYLDAANRKSYPGTGTTWYDLSSNAYQATIANGPVFSEANKGSFNCDPTNDFIYLNNTMNTAYVTVSVIYKKDSSSGTSDHIVWNKEYVWELRDVSNNLSWAVSASNRSWFWYDTGYDVTLNQILKVDITYDGNYVKTWINGSLYHTYTYPAGGTLTQSSSYPKLNSRHSTQTTWQNGGDHTYYNFSVYNRALNADEIKQNYEALKGRYGL